MDLRELLTNPEFRALPQTEQLKGLREVAPEFGQLPEPEQLKALTDPALQPAATNVALPAQPKLQPNAAFSGIQGPPQFSGPLSDPNDPTSALPSAAEALQLSQRAAQQDVTAIAQAAIQPSGGAINRSYRMDKEGFTAADFGGDVRTNTVPTESGEFQRVMSAWGSQVFPRLPEEASRADKTANAIGRVLTNFASPDSLTMMAGVATAAEALPVLANLPGIAAKLKDLPKLLKALDVTAAAAVPVAVTAKQGYDLVEGGIPDNYEDAVETGAHALLTGAGIFGAIKSGREVLASHPSAQAAPGAPKPTAGASRQKALELGQQGKRLAAADWAAQAKKLSTDQWGKVFGEDIAIDLNGQAARIQFAGATGGQGVRAGKPSWTVVDEATGKTLYGGYARDVQEWLRTKEAKPGAKKTAAAAPVEESAPAPAAEPKPAVIAETAARGPEAFSRWVETLREQSTPARGKKAKAAKENFAQAGRDLMGHIFADVQLPDPAPDLAINDESYYAPDSDMDEAEQAQGLYTESRAEQADRWANVLMATCPKRHARKSRIRSRRRRRRTRTRSSSWKWRSVRRLRTGCAARSRARSRCPPRPKKRRNRGMLRYRRPPRNRLAGR
jgi:hypothetical protein